MIKSDCGHSISSYRLWSISASLVVGEVTDVVFLLSVCFILHDPFYRTMVLGMFVVERMAHEPLLYLYILEKQKYLTLTQGKKGFTHPNHETTFNSKHVFSSRHLGIGVSGELWRVHAPHRRRLPSQEDGQPTQARWGLSILHVVKKNVWLSAWPVAKAQTELWSKSEPLPMTLNRFRGNETGWRHVEDGDNFHV